MRSILINPNRSFRDDRADLNVGLDLYKTFTVVIRARCNDVSMSAMEQFTAIRKVKLSDHHLRPGRTTHMLVDSTGKRPFAHFDELVIAHYPGTVGYYLMHHSIDGTATDTWHESLEDALHQGEWEFEVKADEWVEASGPYVR